MAYDQRSLDDYVDVATRIAEFRDRYPDGSLQPWGDDPWRIVQAQGFDRQGDVCQQTFIVYMAAAYRNPDDKRPGVGCAWEVFPGRTNFTRGSELQNAETSAWGRAIIAALASDSKQGVASREEVRNRQAENSPGPGAGRQGTGEPGPGRTTRPPTDVPTGQRPGRAKTTGPEHERLREGAVTGPVAGATRTKEQPADSQWYTGPAEDRPGSLFDSQRSHIMAKLGKMTRDNRLARVSQLVGRTVESVNDLSITEAQRVIARLEAAG